MSLTRIAGDPGAIASYARQMTDYSNELTDAARALRQVASTDTTISAAIDELRNDALKAAEDAGKVVTRYVGTADTLAKYAVVLEPIQTAGNAAADAWDTARADITYWTRKRDDAAADYAMAADGSPEQEEFRRLALSNQNHLDSAWDRYRDAQTKYDQAIAEYNAAAAAAVQGINAAESACHLNDGFWDEVGGLYNDVTNWVYEHAELLENIKKVCDAIASVLSWAALIVSVCGFPEVGVLLGEIALGFTAVSFVISLLLFLSGASPFGELLKSGISLVVSIVTLGVVPKSVTGDLIKTFLEPIIDGAETGNAIDGFYDIPSAGDTVDLLPSMDTTLAPPVESLDGPMWTRPPDMEIPSFDPLDYAPQDVPQAVCENAQVSFEAGDLKIQAFVEVCR